MGMQRQNPPQFAGGRQKTRGPATAPPANAQANPQHLLAGALRGMSGFGGQAPQMQPQAQPQVQPAMGQPGAPQMQRPAVMPAGPQPNIQLGQGPQMPQRGPGPQMPGRGLGPQMPQRGGGGQGGKPGTAPSPNYRAGPGMPQQMPQRGFGGPGGKPGTAPSPTYQGGNPGMPRDLNYRRGMRR
jgi:hypothetical protein